jgi:two-component system, NtrC family, sensor kinase
MRRPDSSRLAYLVLPLLLAAGVAVLGGVSAVRKVEAFQSLGFTAVRDGGAWRVGAAPEPVTRLRQGDLILAVDNLPVGAAEEMRRRLLDEPRAEVLVKRGDGLERIAYARPGLTIDLRYLVLAASGVIYLLIGLFTLYRQRQRQSLLFFFWCLASAALYLFAPLPPYDPLDKGLFIGDELARLLLPPLTLHLFLVFPAPLRGWRRLLRAIPFVYLPAAVLATLHADLMFTGGALFVGRPTDAVLRALDRAEIYHLGIYVLATLALLALHLARAQTVEEKRQLRWISFGMATGYLPFVVFYAVPLALRLGTSELVRSLAVVPLGLVPLTFAWAILRYKLWDIDLIVRNTITYTLTFLLGVVGFALVNLVINRGVPEELAQARTLLTFAAGLVIAGLLVPAHRGIGASLERFQYRGSFRQRRALAELGREMLHERDLDRLCARLLDHLAGGMELAQVNLYLAQGEALVAVRPQPDLPPQLPFTVVRSEDWRRDAVAISGAEAPGPRPSPPLRLFLAGYRYAFPLVVRDRQVGLVITGYRLAQRPLSSEDVDLVRQLLNQAALAIENAQLLDQLHQQLAEVLRIKRHTEGIIESSPAGLAVLDDGGRVLSANLAFAALVGIERRALLGGTIGELLPVPLPEPGEGLVEVRCTTADGAERSLQLSVSELGEAGSAGQRVLVAQDVSERVAIENELKEKDRLASLGMLAAGVAHEVNTPITGISSYAQMLLDETPEGDPRRDLLKKVERQTFRAARIVGSLLEFARNRHGEYRPLALAPIVGEVLEEAAERLAEMGIRLSWQPPAEELAVRGSDSELAQVFTNLVANAIEAMPAGGELAVSLAAAGDRVLAAVEDNGVGIPPEQLEKVFQPFFSTKLAAGGTGLGLSISYEVVRRHGGEIRVASDPGRGSRFVVELPRVANAGGPG